MDNTASDKALAEELQATRVRVADLEMQVGELSDRITNIASQLGKLTKVLKQVMAENYPASSSAAISTPESPAADVPEPAEETGGDEALEIEIPRELLQAIRLITEHRSEEAQKHIQSLPRELLAEYPGIVAMVAAAVRIRKGEFEVARAALAKSRELVRDQRLQRVIKFLEKQLNN